MISRAIAGAAAGFLLAVPALALEPGDPAPALEHVEWIKGEPIAQFEEGHVYVLDFWATWCGPCVASIPHLNEMQEEYRDDKVHVVGVAIWPRQGMVPTAEFVEERGDEMGYWIAEDKGEGQTAEDYMTAAGRNGIPTVFVVDKQGKVAWIGHPMDGLDRVVETLIDGSFSLEAMEAERKKAEKLESDLQDAFMNSDWERVVEVTTDMLEHDEKKYSAAAVYKYLALAKLGDDEASRKKARTYGAQITSSLFAEDPDSLEALAWFIVGPDSYLTEEETDAEFALVVAKKASGLLDDEDISKLETLARAYHAAGKPEKAVETQKKALAQLEQEFEPYRDNPQAMQQFEDAKAHLQSSLDEYQQALASTE